MTLKNIYRYIEEFIDTTIFRNLFKSRWQPLYWLRSHTFNRYHILDISGQDGYKWGWIDSDTQMELACFKILTNFVENEYPGHCDWDSEETIRKVRDEIFEIYNWWTKGLKAEEDAIHTLFEKSGWSYSFSETEETKSLPENQKLYSMNSATKDLVAYEEYKARSAQLKITKEEMLHRLLQARKHMWT